jgi:hypothetical protein
VRISDDLHRELAEEYFGLPGPQAIIGACGARVERALRPRDLRPEPRTNAHLPGESKHWTHSNRIFPAPYAAYAPQRCGERSRPARKASERPRLSRSRSSPLQPAKRQASRRNRRSTTEPRGSCYRRHKTHPAASHQDSHRSHHPGKWDTHLRRIRKAERPDRQEHIRSRTDWTDIRMSCSHGTHHSSNRWQRRGTRTRRGGERDVSFLNFLFEGVGGSLPVSNGSICRLLTSEQMSTEPAAGEL